MKHTKLIAALTCALMTIGLVGCSKEPADLIIGTWNATNATMTMTITGMGEDYDGSETEEFAYKEGEYTMIFYKDNTMSIKMYDSEDGTEESMNGTYSISDNKLYLESADDADYAEMDIVSLDKKNLVLGQKLEMPMGEDGQGRMTMETKITLKRA